MFKGTNRVSMVEPSDELLVTITESVSDASNIPITELPPLSHSIEPEGLVAIVEADLSHDVTVTFPYAGHRVLVHSDNTVYVHPIKNAKFDRGKTVKFSK